MDTKQRRTQSFGIGGVRIGVEVWEGGCAPFAEFLQKFYAEIMHLCAKLSRSYKMHPVSGRRAS